ncbi:OPT family oligopeptide transporter [Flavisphingomonas formosensis]|uniref:OPT family oligopeptide transporter n=1 Tax=Flavisphingomonas formosensis TaxID=861534 RepID=UPI0012F99936|nr:oligopeptide transporter, OPT family [Sphingomonas formosensis]
MASQAAAQSELTLRGIALGFAITLVFTAANVYLGLKVGLTFATSIPAAVISMALLRFVRGAGILENNIVQTIASAAGTLAAIAFVLPGLVMTGWWHSFPFLPSFLVCVSGGILGVLLSIPLRRALVTGSDLPYPEGVAAAEVLKVGAESREGAEENQTGLRAIVIGSLVSAGFAAISAMRLFAAEAGSWFRVGGGASGISVTLSFALIGAGHLVGISVGMAMLLGVIIAFGIATPFLTWLHHTPGSAAEAAQSVFSGEVRFIGAGVIGIAAIWTLAKLARPLASGLAGAAAASRARRGSAVALPVEERDLPLGIGGIILAALIVPVGIVLYGFLQGGPLAPLTWPLIAGALLYILLGAAFVASVCGYMAGLIGASNSPLSGVGILAIIGAALLLAGVVQPVAGPQASQHLVAFALFVTAVIFASATIANDNLQDLKTGQLVGATPWRQQVALMIGVVAGSLVIPPILDLLNTAYGFASAVPGAVQPTNPLPAPQATLITALARGVLGEGLDWSLIGGGAGLGAGLILLDALLGRLKLLRLPPLAVGIAIYLPISLTMPLVIGAVVGFLYERGRGEAGKRIGVLLASGFIVGESLFGVLLALLIVVTGSATPLAIVGDSFETAALVIGGLAFLIALSVSYRWIMRQEAAA